MTRKIATFMLTVSLAAALAGCSRSPRVTFYTLESGVKVEAASAASALPWVVVGPVTLPELVDRPQLVVRVAANRVDILETHRWAAPLKSELPRAIAQDLGRLLGSNRVSSYLLHTGAEADYRVLVDFRRFESLPGQAVTLEADWYLRRGAGGAAKTGHFLAREPVLGEGYDPLMAAYGRALLALSGDLAEAIRAETALGH